MTRASTLKPFLWFAFSALESCDSTSPALEPKMVLWLVSDVRRARTGVTVWREKMVLRPTRDIALIDGAGGSLWRLLTTEGAAVVEEAEKPCWVLEARGCCTGVL